MEQRVSMITLGVSDLVRSRTFYEDLGWRGQQVQDTVFFQAGGYAGYFTDPDGHVWEIAFNPGFPISPDGTLTVPFLESS